MHDGDEFAYKRILRHTPLSTTDGSMEYAQSHLAQYQRFAPMTRVEVPKPSRATRQIRRVAVMAPIATARALRSGCFVHHSSCDGY